MFMQQYKPFFKNEATLVLSSSDIEQNIKYHPFHNSNISDGFWFNQIVAVY